MAKWFTQEIRQLINKLRFKRRKNDRNPSSERQARIDNDERVLMQKIDMARSNWERNLVDEFAGNSNHKIYNHIRSLTRNTQLPQLMISEPTKLQTTSTKLSCFSTLYNRNLQLLTWKWHSVSWKTVWAI